MQGRTLNVRFAPVKTAPATLTKSPARVDADIAYNHCPQNGPRRAGRKGSRSRTGCRQCKTRKVKCDEAFPICLRCRKGGLICDSAQLSSGWHLELPWVLARNLSDSVRHNADNSLMEWWFDKACDILVADNSANPLSYPLLEHISSSAALLHSLQCISSGHRQYFAQSCYTTCLQQRSMALRQVQIEMRDESTSPVASFLSILMLGISAPWIDGTFQDTGVEHFLGARAVLDRIISKKSDRKDSIVRFIMGFYLFWDMAISLVADTEVLPSLDTPDFDEIVKDMDEYSHPIGGFPVRIFYLLARVNRYYRGTTEGLPRDLLFEFEIEDQLSQWECQSENEHFELLAKSFKNQGLMILQRAQSTSYIAGFDHDDLEARIVDNARETVDRLLQTPITQHCFNMQATPLVLAASELTAEYTKERAAAIDRLKAIYSISRVATILCAIDLLAELWLRRDSGEMTTYFELMERKGWRLNLI
ncbi:hypothetical protein ACHAPJ_012140 [Fusarium lateritium]